MTTIEALAWAALGLVAFVLAVGLPVVVWVV